MSRRAAKAPSCLYPKEAEIAELVLGPGRFEEWKGLAVVLERSGLPRRDDATGARFWPAVEHWFRARHGLVKLEPGQLGPPDGVETCPTPKQRKRDDRTPKP